MMFKIFRRFRYVAKIVATDDSTMSTADASDMSSKRTLPIGIKNCASAHHSEDMSADITIGTDQVSLIDNCYTVDLDGLADIQFNNGDELLACRAVDIPADGDIEFKAVESPDVAPAVDCCEGPRRIQFDWAEGLRVCDAVVPPIKKFIGMWRSFPLVSLIIVYPFKKPKKVLVDSDARAMTSPTRRLKHRRSVTYYADIFPSTAPTKIVPKTVKDAQTNKCAECDIAPVYEMREVDLSIKTDKDARMTLKNEADIESLELIARGFLNPLTPIRSVVPKVVSSKPIMRINTIASMSTWIYPEFIEPNILYIRQAYDVKYENGVLEVH